MKKKQAIAFLLSAAMTTGTVIPALGAASDINGHWAQATIAKWQDAGRIGGYEDGTFKPDRTITRAEFVRLLNSATSTSFTSNASVNFSDVKESDWFYADVAKAVGAKITSGFEDGTFRPGETVTRMQAAVFICNAKGLAANEAGANLLTDASEIPAWAKGAVGAVISAGYMSGYPDGSFGGSKGMTRAEAVSTLDRVLGGGVTTPAPDNQGVSTPSTDNEDTTTIAEAKQEGNMVWRSGGGGGGSRGSSSSNGGSSSSDNDSDIVTKDTTINNQSDANKLKGKTVFGDVTINLNSNLDLENVRFKGNVKVNSGTVAAAYIGDDTAVAAANTTKWTILLIGTTSFDGNVTVTSDKADAPLVEIKTLSRKAISNFIARTAARIVGFTTAKVQASAPVEVADGKVENVTAETGAEITVEKDAEVANVAVTGDAKVTVQDGAKVDKVAVTGNANADVALEGTAKVDTVTVSDTATAKVDVAADAEVGTITVTSTNSKPATIVGDGNITKIEAVNPDAVNTDGAANAPKVEEIGGTTTPEKPGEEETSEIAKTALAALKVTAPTKDTKNGAEIKTTAITGVDIAAGTWTRTEESTGGDNTGSGADQGGAAPQAATTKTVKFTGTVTLKPDSTHTFAADVAELTEKDFAAGVKVEKVTASTTSVVLEVSQSVEVTEEPEPEVQTPTTVTMAAGNPTKVQKGTTATFKAIVKDQNSQVMAEGSKVTVTCAATAGSFAEATELEVGTNGEITLPTYTAGDTAATDVKITVTLVDVTPEAKAEATIEITNEAVGSVTTSTEGYSIDGTIITVPATATAATFKKALTVTPTGATITVKSADGQTTRADGDTLVHGDTVTISASDAGSVVFEDYTIKIVPTAFATTDAIVVMNGSTKVTEETAIDGGVTLTLSANLTPENANQEVTWTATSQDNAGIVTSCTNGQLVLGQNQLSQEVTVIITATAKDNTSVTDTFTVKVKGNTQSTTPAITASAEEVETGKETKVTFTPANFTDASSIEWTAAAVDKDGAAVNSGFSINASTGELTVESTAVAGTVITVTATSGDESATATVTVKAAVTQEPAITASAEEVETGKETKVTFTPANFTDASSIEWTAAAVDKDGAAVNSGFSINASTGELTVESTAAAGTVITVTATSGDESATATVTVKAAAQP